MGRDSSNSDVFETTKPSIELLENVTCPIPILVCFETQSSRYCFFNIWIQFIFLFYFYTMLLDWISNILLNLKWYIFYLFSNHLSILLFFLGNCATLQSNTTQSKRLFISVRHKLPALNFILQYAYFYLTQNKHNKRISASTFIKER